MYIWSLVERIDEKGRHVLRQILLWLFLCLILITSCAINRIRDEKTVIMLDKGRTGNPVTLTLERGPNWTHEYRPGPFVIHIYPQGVFWLESGTGEFMETLYISGADGDYGNNSTKRKLDSEFFRRCFPVWAGRMAEVNQPLPTKERPYTDAVTTATPQSGFDLKMNLGEIPDKVKILFEINKSNDFNIVYTKDNSGWVGQPSVVYAVEIDEIKPDSIYYFEAVGHGSRLSEKHEFVEGFEGMDSALELVEGITVKFE